VQLVPGVKLHRVAVLLNRDNAAEMQLRRSRRHWAKESDNLTAKSSGS